MLFSALFRKNIKQFEDSQLVELIKKNKSSANGELFRRYAVLVMGLCLKYLKNHANAEDLTMEIFEKLPEKIIKSDIHHFKNWLYSVTRNECLMFLRKTKKNNSNIDDVLLYEIDKSPTLLEAVFEKETKLNELEVALNKLKEPQKESLELFYLKQKSYVEVSTIMNIPIKKVKSLIQNGKRNLKLKLEEKDAL